jgi:hypothetical protein
MANRFPHKPTLETIQALSVVCQQFGGGPEPRLSLIESFQLNVLLLKVHMTRAEVNAQVQAQVQAEAKPSGFDEVRNRESSRESCGVTCFTTDIPSLPFAQPFVPRLTAAMIKSLQHKGYHVCVPPPGDPNYLARVCWTRVDDLHHVGGWRVYAPTGILEPLHVDADLHPAAPRLEDCPEAWWAPIQHLHVSF